MTFGKGNQKNVSELGRKGAESSNKKHNHFKKLWNNEEWAKNKAKQSSKIMTDYNNSMTKEKFAEHCRNAGKKSRKLENEVASKIKGEYDFMFTPFRVCDRIAIKDGILIFIEIKPKKKQNLRPQQKKFKEICKQLGITYKIVTD